MKKTKQLKKLNYFVFFYNSSLGDITLNRSFFFNSKIIVTENVSNRGLNT